MTYTEMIILQTIIESLIITSMIALAVTIFIFIDEKYTARKRIKARRKILSLGEEINMLYKQMDDIKGEIKKLHKEQDKYSLFYWKSRLYE